MKFLILDVIAITTYSPTPADFYETEDVWFNIHDVIEVDFDVAVESLFIRDLLEGRVSPIDEEARDYTKQVSE